MTGASAPVSEAKAMRHLKFLALGLLPLLLLFAFFAYMEQWRYDPFMANEIRCNMMAPVIE